MAGETVLAVDDREDSLKFLREYVLEPNGYRMIEARNGADALDIILGQKIDLIISDLVMPRMGGLELLESLREKGLDTPAILMTFHGSEGTAVRAFRLGARDYIIKPFAIDEMLGAIDRALTESRLRQERDHLTQTVLRVNQQLENRVQELRFLYGIGRSVTSLRDLEPILNRIVEAAVYLTGAEEGSIMLIDEASGELYLRAARGMGEKNARSSRLKIQDSIAGQVVRTGRPVMIGGANQDDSFKVATGYFVKALLNVPLKVTDRVIGVLAVNNQRKAQAFAERHLNLLMALADYASIAIENARLYARLSTTANQAEQSSRELEKAVKSQTSQLQQVNQQLLRAEKAAALGYMAAGVAREINVPINSILQNLHEVSQQNLEPKEQLQLVARAEQEAQRCQEIIQNLLDFSGQRNYRPRQTNLNDVVEQAWLKFSHENNLNPNVKFMRGFDPHLPHVMVDPQQMEQAVFYLIRRAYEAMPQGGALRIISRTVGAQVQLIVSDTGQGIAPEDMRHIFDPFYESNNHTYGLDLSITYAVIGRHSGQIEVESEPDQGTTFTIHLPRPVQS
ncbi:MAG: response regulator [Anaerolineales bacterium]|nr:response regulator [Anaerolineales bacterium]